MNGTESQQITEREDLLEELFRHATARERPPPDDEVAIREALHAEWRVITGRRQRRRVALSLAAAASLLLAVLIGTNMQREPLATTPSEQLASIQRVTGNAGLRSSGNGSVREPRSGEILQSGQTLVTGSSSRLAVRRARRAHDDWSQRSFSARGRVFMKYHDLIIQRQDEILDIIQLETGKARQHAFEEIMDVAMVARASSAW